MKTSTAYCSFGKKFHQSFAKEAMIMNIIYLDILCKANKTDSYWLETRIGIFYWRERARKRKKDGKIEKEREKEREQDKQQTVDA